MYHSLILWVCRSDYAGLRLEWFERGVSFVLPDELPALSRQQNIPEGMEVVAEVGWLA